MPAKFTAHTAAIINPLTDLHRELANLTASCHIHRDSFSTTSSAVLEGAAAFVGDAATAYGETSTELTRAWDDEVESLDAAVSACQQCLTRLQFAAENADGRYVNDFVLDRILEELSPQDIVTDGIEAAESAFARVAQGITDALNAGEHWLANVLEGGLQLLEKLLHLGAILVEDVWNLIIDTVRVVRTWVTDVYDTCTQWIKQIQAWIDHHRHLPGYRHNVTITKQSQALNMIQYGYAHDAPIGISTMPDGHTLLLTLGGLQALNVFQSNNLGSAVEGGLNLNNAYLRDVRQAILDYIKEHNLTPPVHLDIVGHSLGGIVAQELLGEVFPPSGAQPYTVDHVVTYGSPLLGPPSPKVQSYFARYDPVPYLSTYEQARLETYAQLHGMGGLSTTTLIQYFDQHPDLKAQVLGETYLKSVGGDPNYFGTLGNINVFPDHGSYLNGDSPEIDGENWGFSPDGATNTEFFPTNLIPNQQPVMVNDNK